MRTYSTVFFDLDGTLLPIDTHKFMEDYFASLGAFCAAEGLEAKPVLAAVMAGVHAMAKTDGEQTNRELFWGVFEQETSMNAASAEDMFMKYYAQAFPQVGAHVTLNEHAARAVATLKSKGYRIALCTMPMFPIIAVEERLRWAGLDSSDFEFVTDYATCNAVKPMERYYDGCLKRAGVSADEVLMVGNHEREDGWITKLGCDIYFITDNLIKDEKGISAEACKHGSMQQFADWCEALPSL